MIHPVYRNGKVILKLYDVVVPISPFALDLLTIHIRNETRSC